MSHSTVIAMSGGVDSSVAAHLLKQQGRDVTGVFFWKPTYADYCEGAASCCSPADAHDAARVAEMLGIDFHVINVAAEFEHLIDLFCREYDAGRTPNPCTVCNPTIKFAKLIEFADRIGAEQVATGHYARTEHRGGRGDHSGRGDRNGHSVLLRAADPAKDQSYVLFALTQDQLARTVFPCGGMSKPDIRRLAAELRLPVHDKPDSQEICFVPDNDYRRLLRERIPDSIKPGPVCGLDGAVLGEHPGVQLFTIGQRHGLRIAFGKPMYVVRLDRDTNTVIVGPDSALMRRELTVSQVNWLAEPPAEPFRAQVKIRYMQPARPATVTPMDGKAQIEFDEPVRAVAPGQAGVFYDDEMLLGGGWIE